MANGNGIFEIYMREITNYPRITHEREIELANTIAHSKNPDVVEKSVSELVQANLRLVVHCLKEFTGYLNSPCISLSSMDLIAEGNIGLMNAARKYNPDYRSEDSVNDSAPKFSTYACQSIKCAMRRALKLSRFIHIPEHHFTYWSRLDELNREDIGITDFEVMNKLDISKDRLRTLRKSRQTSATMLEDMFDDDDSHWSEFIEDTNARMPDNDMEMFDLNEVLTTELRRLPDRTRKIIHHTFLSNKTPSLTELSEKYGLSKERCRQICMRGLHLLKKQILEKWANTGTLAAFGIKLPTFTMASNSTASADTLAHSMNLYLTDRFPGESDTVEEDFEQIFVA